MKKLLIVLFCISMSLPQLSAQDLSESKNHEIFLNSTSLLGGNIGFQYKSSINENTYLRFGLGNLNLRHTKSIPGGLSTIYETTNFSAGGRIQAGIEKRLKLSEKVQFYYGLDLYEYFRYSNNSIDNPNLPLEDRKIGSAQSSTGLSSAFGVLINVKNHLFFSAELEPSVSYSLTWSGISNNSYTRKQQDIDLDLNLQTVRIALMYRLN